MYPADRDAVLFELRPSVLAERLAGALQHGAVVARPSFDLPRAVRDWAKWHIAEAARPKRRRLAMPTGRPLVSVCMTHHNRPQYLRQAIDSVVRQDYQPLELVLVDDSDQADARAAVARYETEFERRGWKIVTVSDRFVGAARNAAARHARGKYVLFMDDDNVAKPHEVSTLVKAAEHAGADVLTCFLDAFTGERPPRSTASVMRRWPFYGRSAAAGLFRNVLGDTNCLVRRRAFLAAGGFTEDEQVGFEDWEMLGRLVKAGLRIEVVPEALVWFRVTGTGMASRHSGRPDHVRALRPFLEMYPGESRLMLKYAKHLSLSQGGQSWAPGARPVATDVRLVRSVAIFGAGEGGRRTATLADTWRWRVACVVDNNQSLWGKRTPWCQVDAPARLEKRDFDLVVVASMAGRDAIMRQLRGMGFPPSREVAYFLDPFDSGTMRVQLTL
jgi:GT2 family glycosyltransferase